MPDLPLEKNGRILVIDDTRSIHDDFRKILTGVSPAAKGNAIEELLFGQPTSLPRGVRFEMDSAHQGRDGFELAQRARAEGRPYAMAFIDVRMPPGWDGIEATARIWEVDPELQIVLCTAYSDYSWDGMNEKLGLSDRLVILKKPFENIEALQLATALTEKWNLARLVRSQVENLERRVEERTRVLEIEIAERKRTEQARREIERKLHLAQKAESLRRMAGAVAHNFNNQLQGVMGNLELAMTDLPRGSGSAQNLNRAMQSACKAAELSGLMLTYLGQAPSKLESLDLSESCRQSLLLLRTSLPKDVEFETDLPAPGPTIKANVHQIQQILANLVSNASEALPGGGGVIGLAVKTVFAADIPLKLRFPLDWQPQGERFACVEVTDTGCGIADRDIEKIFDPFFYSKSTERGLGLSVVLGIARTYHGAVTVDSTAERGSILRVFLPVATEAVSRLPTKTVEVPDIEIKGTDTVLLVDDEAVVRDTGAAVLTRLGYTVHQAKDDIEAIEVFRQYQSVVQCVVCDLTMPRMSGWETLAALRKLSPDIPVVLASGYDQAQAMAGDHPDSPQAFLHKPYTATELCEAIRHALENSGNGNKTARAHQPVVCNNGSGIACFLAERRIQSSNRPTRTRPEVACALSAARAVCMD